MPEKQDHKKRGTIYDYQKDTMAVLSSMIDSSFGPRMYEAIIDDIEENGGQRYQPSGWNMVEDIKNVRAGFMTTGEDEKLIRLTYHTVFIADADYVPDKVTDEANKIINKCVTQLKKEYKKLTGDTLTLKAAKVGEGKGKKKDGLHVDVDVVSNPRVETSHMNTIGVSQNPRLYAKFSKFYFFGKSFDDGDISEKYGDSVE